MIWDYIGSWRPLRASACQEVAEATATGQGGISSPLLAAVHPHIVGGVCDSAFLDCGGKRQRHAALGTHPPGQKRCRAALATAVQKGNPRHLTCTISPFHANLGVHRDRRRYLGFLYCRFQPGRAKEHSPAFQRWAWGWVAGQVPSGTAERGCPNTAFLSSQSGLVAGLARSLSVETLGYALSPCRAGDGLAGNRAAWRLLPSVLRRLVFP